MPKHFCRKFSIVVFVCDLFEYSLRNMLLSSMHCNRVSKSNLLENELRSTI